MNIETHVPFQVAFKPRSATDMIVVHCSATLPSPKIDWKTIDMMHRQRGYLTIGYHFVIKTDGTVQEGRPIDAIGAHAKGHNDNSIGICLVGGIDSKGKSKANFTRKQYDALDRLVSYLLGQYPEIRKIVGHRDLPNVAKDCPCFDVKPRYGNLLKKHNNN